MQPNYVWYLLFTHSVSIPHVYHPSESTQVFNEQPPLRNNAVANIFVALTTPGTVLSPRVTDSLNPYKNLCSRSYYCRHVTDEKNKAQEVRYLAGLKPHNK